MEGKKKGKKSKSNSSDVRECDSTASWDKSLNRECIYSTHPGNFYVVLHGSLIGNKLANKKQQKVLYR